MLKFILQILLLFLLLRLLFPIFRGVGSALRRLFGPAPKKEKLNKEPDYSSLSPYEIEDADYEEIKKDEE
ncbi:MAG: hypothetical protein GTO51_06805 [Candidatus Latescibacteria bacterium]|nr:hypothetical protein [Candidatus Latescibacterota bacterium]NIM21513.1 hypothetical protein [Candidatus Latescibacterota bacterium]NIM65684.1 hypothetical protein [Candidatus Latescibacterota bacterium]NIO02066.1 hypothetical protein [Candidatus Latescibacterota bacterium]NIO28878.1 hypothetical protein [Candidatus Latescibacterota bacterium]